MPSETLFLCTRRARRQKRKTLKMSLLQTTIEQIKPVDQTLTPAIQAHLDDLTKPQGSLGQLEAIAHRFCSIHQTTKPYLPKKRICCFAGDHGVTAQGVSAFPQEVTPQMVVNILLGGAAISVLTKENNIDLQVIDMGVASPLPEIPGAESALEKLIDCKVAPGTKDITLEAAMTEPQAQQALEAGITLAQQAVKDGIGLLGTGDMGIGNTTPSTALYSAYLNISPDSIVGRGTGVDDDGLSRKLKALETALDRYHKIDAPSTLTTFAQLGGYEIAGICGLILGAAANHIPVVIDGFISTAAAVTACQFNPAVADYLFFSHLSHEQGHATILENLGATPILSLGLRLGEGSGAALAMPLIDNALHIYNNMATFSSAGVAEKS